MSIKGRNRSSLGEPRLILSPYRPAAPWKKLGLVPLAVRIGSFSRDRVMKNGPCAVRNRVRYRKVGCGKALQEVIRD